MLLSVSLLSVQWTAWHGLHSMMRPSWAAPQIGPSSCGGGISLSLCWASSPPRGQWWTSSGPPRKPQCLQPSRRKFWRSGTWAPACEWVTVATAASPQRSGVPCSQCPSSVCCVLLMLFCVSTGFFPCSPCSPCVSVGSLYVSSVPPVSSGFSPCSLCICWVLSVVFIYLLCSLYVLHVSTGFSWFFSFLLQSKNVQVR